jgi:hypothetical protein
MKTDNIYAIVSCVIIALFIAVMEYFNLWRDEDIDE